MFFFYCPFPKISTKPYTPFFEPRLKSFTNPIPAPIFTQPMPQLAYRCLAYLFQTVQDLLPLLPCLPCLFGVLFCAHSLAIFCMFEVLPPLLCNRLACFTKTNDLVQPKDNDPRRDPRVGNKRGDRAVYKPARTSREEVPVPTPPRPNTVVRGIRGKQCISLLWVRSAWR